MLFYDIGTKVKVVNPFSSINCFERLGIVAGHAYLQSVTGQGASPVYLIRLEEGFYDPAGDMYVSVIVVQSDCVSLA